MTDAHSNSPQGSDDRLEQLITRTLRGQPLLRAPRSLELRVIEELERRASLPWWRMSFGHWPISARTLFVLTSVAIAWLAVGAMSWMLAYLQPASTMQLLQSQRSPLGDLVHTVASIEAAGQALIHSIPSFWVYGGLALIATLYLALFGLGTAAYRSLYLRS
jgi:hypothetical protein